MQKFMCILNNSDGTPNYRYPSELYGTSKSEIYNLLLENTPAENIAVIYTEEEYYNFMNSSNGKVMTSAFSDNSEDDGNTFFNKMLTAAAAVAANNAGKSDNITQVSPALSTEEMPHSPITQLSSTNSTSTKYFEDNGIKYKFSNGNLYKKVWIDLTQYDDESLAEYRIVNVNTKKPINNPKYRIEHLDWQLIK